MRLDLSVSADNVTISVECDASTADMLAADAITDQLTRSAVNLLDVFHKTVQELSEQRGEL